jgi:protein SCO1/2
MSDVQRVGSHAYVWPLSRGSTALLAGACVVVGVAGGLALHSTGARHAPSMQPASVSAGGLVGDAVWGPGRRRAPPFALRDQSNRLVSLSAQRGRILLLAFMDSHCKLLCSLEGPAISRVLRHVRPGPVTLLVVSVNPSEDTAASSRAAAAGWRIRGDWHWLRGSAAELRPIWRAYGIEVRKTAGEVNHSAAVYLIDGRGYERAGFNFPFPGREVTRNLRLLASRAS